MLTYVDVFLCLCALALNAVGSLTVTMTTTDSVKFDWSPPAGHFEGFHVYGNASSDAAVDCNDTVYGKNVYIFTTDGG